VIGYYVHHVGSGHLSQASCIAAALADEVAVLSSLPRPEGWQGEWVLLPRDDTGGPPVDPTAQGRLHWVPSGDDGLCRRMATISGWLDRRRPRALVSDVSVEVAVLARLHGVPVVSVVLPGERGDPAHQLGFAVSDALLAPWPAPSRSADDDDRVQYVGAISRFDGRDRIAAAPSGAHRVLVLHGRGGCDLDPDDVPAAARATPGWTWTALGGPSADWRPDPWPELCAADVVVVHAGLAALADVAAARRPAVVIAQDRPHSEQQATARAVEAAGLAVVLPCWPEPGSWPGHLDHAAAVGGQRWAEWSSGDGAVRAAAVVESVTAGRAPAA